MEALSRWCRASLGQRPSATSVLQGAINAALEGLVRGLALEFCAYSSRYGVTWTH